MCLSKAGAYSRVAHFNAPLIVGLLALLTSTKLGREDFPMTNTVAYYENS
jgi:hypothetical protein